MSILITQGAQIPVCTVGCSCPPYVAITALALLQSVTCWQLRCYLKDSVICCCCFPQEKLLESIFPAYVAHDIQHNLKEGNTCYQEDHAFRQLHLSRCDDVR